MSFKRTIPTDQINTASLITAGRAYIPTGNVNWLGHRNTAGTAHIDSLLLQGATLQQLGGKRKAVTEHINHLRIEHGLTITVTNGSYQFQ